MADEIDVEALRRAAEHPVSGALAVTPRTMLALLSRLAAAERERDEARQQRNALEAALASWERRARRSGPECIYCDSDAVGVTRDGRPLCTHHARGVRDFLRAPEGT